MKYIIYNTPLLEKNRELNKSSIFFLMFEPSNVNVNKLIEFENTFYGK